MGRPLLIVALVGLMLATGVAYAEPSGEVRLPITWSGPVASAIPHEVVPHDVTPHQVVVVKGDHLWKISERHLEVHAPERPVGPYWRRVIVINTPTLRSGDPDLIYPGEVVRLPDLSEQP